MKHPTNTGITVIQSSDLDICRATHHLILEDVDWSLIGLFSPDTGHNWNIWPRVNIPQTHESDSNQKRVGLYRSALIIVLLKCLHTVKMWNLDKIPSPKLSFNNGIFCQNKL